MNKRKIHWALVMPGILSFVFLLAALVINSIRAGQDSGSSAAFLGVVVLPIIIGLGVVIIPVVIIIKRNTKRNRHALEQLKSQYPHVYYTVDFRNGQRLLAADKKVVSIWRARRKGLEQEISWPRGSIAIEKATIPISRAVTVPGIVFTDPRGKLRRMAVSDTVAARINPIDYGSFLPYIQ